MGNFVCRSSRIAPLDKPHARTARSSLVRSTPTSSGTVRLYVSERWQQNADRSCPAEVRLQDVTARLVGHRPWDCRRLRRELL
jgi:hypothetical protein